MYNKNLTIENGFFIWYNNLECESKAPKCARLEKR